MISVGALDGDVHAARLVESGEDFGAGIGRGGRWGDACVGQELVAWQGLEEGDGFGEEVDDFLLGDVVGVAAWLEGADAGAVFAPFVLPEGFVARSLVFPVGVHVGEGVCGAAGCQNGADVGVRASGIAVGVVGAVTVIWPKTVDRPRIRRALGWATVPELCLPSLLATR